MHYRDTTEWSYPARFKCFLLLPAQFALDLRCINRITAIMAGAICHKGNQIGIALAICTQTLLVENGADCLNNVQIGAFRASANVVALAQFACGRDQSQRACMILNIEPVTHIRTCTVNRQRLLIERIKNNKRDQLFREMERAIIV